MATIHSQSGQSSDSGVHQRFPRIGGFTILEHLHEGSHSSIYRARQDRLGRVVALKLLPEWPPPTDVALERFNRAAYVMAQAPNGNLATLYDTGTRDGFHFASMEFLAGQTLQRQLAQVPHTDEAFAVQAGLQVARALTALHAKEICHRNVKPKNILVETSGGIRLIGLGLASCKSAFFSPHLDAHAIGTPHFMAPEMIRGCCADPRSDLYSLGVTLYLMTAGRPPFEAGIPAAVMTRHLTESPRSLSQIRPDLSPQFVQTVHTLIARDPDQRYQTAREATAALENLSLRQREHSRVALRAIAQGNPPPPNSATASLLSHAEPAGSTHAIVRHPIFIAVLSAMATVLMLGLMAMGMYWWWGTPATTKTPAPAAPPVVAPAAANKPATPGNAEAMVGDHQVTAQDREFTRLLALAADHRADPAAGADAWAAFLNAYPTGDEQLLAAARARLDKCLRDMNEMQIKQRPAAAPAQTNKPTTGATPAKRAEAEMDF